MVFASHITSLQIWRMGISRLLRTIVPSHSCVLYQRYSNVLYTTTLLTLSLLLFHLPSLGFSMAGLRSSNCWCFLPVSSKMSGTSTNLMLFILTFVKPLTAYLIMSFSVNFGPLVSLVSSGSGSKLISVPAASLFRPIVSLCFQESLREVSLDHSLFLVFINDLPLSV